MRLAGVMTQWPSSVVIVGLIAVACGPGTGAPADGTTAPNASSSASAPSFPSTGRDLAIEFRSDPDPIREGDNALEVTVKQPDGSPVTDATVTTVFSMPAMPSMNMPAMRTEAVLAHDASGRYRGTGRLSMGGTWNVTVTVSRGSDELGRRAFSVIAK